MRVTYTLVTIVAIVFNTILFEQRDKTPIQTPARRRYL